MSSSQISNKLTDITVDIQKILKHLSKLDSINETLTKKIENEITQRQNLEKHTLTTHEAFTGQLKVLKETTDHFEEVVTNTMDKSRLAILEDVQKKNNKLIELIENQIKSQTYFNDNINENKDNKDIKDTNYYSAEQIVEKFENLEKFINNEFNQYRAEINDCTTKINFIEKKMYELYEQNQNEINVIKKEINGIKRNINNINEFKKQTENNQMTNKMENINTNENINKLNIKIETILANLDNKLNSYEEVFETQIKNFNDIKNNIIEHMKQMNVNSGSNINELKEYLSTKMSKFNKELDSFENHVLNEHKKFIDYIQSNWEEHNSANKKLYDYIIQDIEILKTKNETTEELIKKLRNDVFKSLNDSEDFLEKKYDSIIRLINK